MLAKPVHSDPHCDALTKTVLAGAPQVYCKLGDWQSSFYKALGLIAILLYG
jgi:hypothetical protein